MGVRCLRLRFVFLRSARAQPHLLENWFEGERLGAKTSAPRRFSNHPSVATYPEWAEREWDRLEGLGKALFFPVGASRPHGLNVNPCALILKPREGAEELSAEIDLWKGKADSSPPPRQGQ